MALIVTVPCQCLSITLQNFILVLYHFSQLRLSFVVSSVSLSLSHWYYGQVWYLIVSIPDLCNLITLSQFKEEHNIAGKY